MTCLKTLLGALVLCAALLVWAGYAIGPDRTEGRMAPGLTAAKVLASDGMAPDGRPAEPDRGGALPSRQAGASSGGKEPAG